MPGKASLEANQYYAHPRNLFWQLMVEILGLPELDYAARCQALKDSGIALWDVLDSCERPSSLDNDIDPASIQVNAIGELLDQHASIALIAFNGAMAEKLFRRHIDETHYSERRLLRLPSTSPANAGIPREEKLRQWRQILRPLPD